MKKYEAIVFDLGGTLIEYAGKYDSWPELESPGLAAAHSFICQRGIPIAELDQFQKIGFNLLPGLWQEAITGARNLTVPIFLTNILERLHINSIDPTIIQDASNLYERAVCAGAVEIPGGKEILEKLQNSGYKLGLISNTMFSGQVHLEDLERFDLIDYFESTLFSADLNLWKPTPEPFLHVVNKLRSQPESAVFIGDDPGADIAGAQNAGMAVIHFAGRDRFTPIDGLVPDATITKLNELPDALAKLNRRSGHGKLD